MIRHFWLSDPRRFRGIVRGWLRGLRRFLERVRRHRGRSADSSRLSSLSQKMSRLALSPDPTGTPNRLGSRSGLKASSVYGSHTGSQQPWSHRHAFALTGVIRKCQRLGRLERPTASSLKGSQHFIRPASLPAATLQGKPCPCGCKIVQNWKQYCCRSSGPRCRIIFALPSKLKT
jgi:hypothetical protein